MRNLNYIPSKKINTACLCCALCLFLGLPKLAAQDPMLAQFYTAPQFLNPAMTGVFKGSARLNANYRQQWGRTFSEKPFRTVHAGFDYRFNIIDDDYLAFGINATEDMTGAASNLRSTTGGISVSYLKQLGGGRRYRSGDTYLVLGGFMGGGQRQVTTGDAWFDRQYDPTAIAVNTNLNSGEIQPRSRLYPDFGLGLLWYRATEDRSIYFGTSLSHINKPNVSFLGNKTELLNRRILVHGGGQFILSQQLSVLPALSAQVLGTQMTSSFGGNVRYSNNDQREVAIRAGLWTRLGNKVKFVQDPNASKVNAVNPSTIAGSGILNDAVTVTGMLEVSNWILGFSYDIHTSKLNRPTNSRGAWEISLQFINPEKRRVNTNCPRM
jgi:type IX secretion system PorP/SprF family membrane protein